MAKDDALMRSLLSSSLVSEGFDAIFERTALDAKRAVAEFDLDFDVVIVDIDLGYGLSGIEFVLGALGHNSHPFRSAKMPIRRRAGLTPQTFLTVRLNYEKA